MDERPATARRPVLGFFMKNWLPPSVFGSLSAIGLIVAVAAFSTSLQAQTTAPWPTRPISLVVTYPPGGGADAMARLIAPKLGEALGQNVIVENKPGAGGTIGNNIVAKAPADGHTVLVGITAIIQQPPLMANLPYDVFRDFAPITRIAISPSLFAVPPSTPVNTLKEFVTLVKSNPGKYNYGTYGAGTSSHIQGALLNMQAGLDMVQIPFSGAAPLVNNMVGGQLTSAFIDMGSGRAHLKSFKVLAVTGTRRLPGLPDVPTFAEQGFHSFDPYGWFAFFLPAATPAAVVNKLSDEVNRILALPDVTARIENMGLWVGGSKPADFAQTIKSDYSIYEKIIRDANIKPENE